MKSNKHLEMLGDAYVKASWLQAIADEHPGLPASGLHVSTADE